MIRLPTTAALLGIPGLDDLKAAHAWLDLEINARVVQEMFRQSEPSLAIGRVQFYGSLNST